MPHRFSTGHLRQLAPQRRKYPQTVTCSVRLSWSARQRVPRRPQGARARSSLLAALIIIIIIIFLLRKRVFEALRMHENSWKLVYTSEVAKIAMFCSDCAWASPAGSIAPPNAWKAIVWSKLILYSWNLVGTSRSLFQTYSSLGFISSAHPEVGHLEFCAIFMHFLHTLTNSS